MITLKNVSKWYGHFQVLTDCSTEVKKGEVVVVCGPSGSGTALTDDIITMEPRRCISIAGSSTRFQFSIEITLVSKTSRQSAAFW